MKILFFARLREMLGDDELEIPDAQCPDTVAGLRALLCEHVNPDLAVMLRDENVFCAVNKVVADEDKVIEAADEVAFFPPMTGG